MADPKTILEFVKKNGVKMLDLRFTDLPGLQHHVSYPIDQLSESSFEEGFGMDGSSIRGWAAIHESDMLLMPDPSTYMLDPFTEVPTLVMVCDVVDPVTKQRYDRDPRYIAKKAEMYLGSTGLAPQASAQMRLAERAIRTAHGSLSFSSTTHLPVRERMGFTSSTLKKDVGIRGESKTTRDIGRATKKAISRCLQRTTIRICAARWS